MHRKSRGSSTSGCASAYANGSISKCSSATARRPTSRGCSTSRVSRRRRRRTDPVFDALFKAMTLIRFTGRAIPGAIVIHPTDWQNVRLTRSSTGEYIMGNPATVGANTLFGLPVAITDVLTAGTALVGDFANFSYIGERRGIEVAIGLLGHAVRRGQEDDSCRPPRRLHGHPSGRVRNGHGPLTGDDYAETPRHGRNQGVRRRVRFRGKDGGAIGTLVMRSDDGSPSRMGRYMLGGYIEVDTPVTSGGAATIAGQIESAGDLQAAAAVSGAPWSTTGRKSIVPVFTGAIKREDDGGAQPHDRHRRRHAHRGEVPHRRPLSLVHSFPIGARRTMTPLTIQEHEEPVGIVSDRASLPRGRSSTRSSSRATPRPRTGSCRRAGSFPPRMRTGCTCR
jgi:hypothetical protein